MTRKARILTSGVAALLICAVAACDFLGLSGPSGPGVIRADIVSPFGVDGAAVIELEGPTGLGSILSDNGPVFFERNGNSTRVVVILDEPGQISFYMRVDDVGELPSATIVQVADGSDELRATVSDYDVDWVQLADSEVLAHRGAS